MPAKFVVLGSTDEVNTCDCCGKHPLKATWAVEMEGGNGDIQYYGSTCVTRNTGKTIKEVRSEAAAAYKAKVDAACSEFSQHPAHVAHKAKMQDGYRLNLPAGKPFMDHHRAEMVEADKARAAIAAKHGVKIFEVRA